jgi:5S rRNA maturation endonuclease (ribonuclease M5)|tara:strand:+ start:1049 stop:1615 length:567 start_codon:yes stop_codon:yes gene_type:complete
VKIFGYIFWLMGARFSPISTSSRRNDLLVEIGADMDPTNTTERFEIAGKALGEARRRNREEDFAIIIEGPKDKAALILLGFEGPIEVVNRGWGMDKLAAYLYETYGTRTDDRRSTMTLLMDWDRTGGKLQANLRRRLESFDVMIDEELRKVLMRALKPETRVVESLGGLAEALMPHMDIETTIRKEFE